MKNILISIMLLTTIDQSPAGTQTSSPVTPPTPSTNLFIITIDGFRWQEIFQGADSQLIHDPSHTPDPETLQLLYWANTPEERRQKLMPFFWNVLSKKGQLYGNRYYHNNFNTANNYSLSYPGYNEMFTGQTDLSISTNRKRNNPNITVLEYLDQQDEFKGRVAAFTSWDVFPYILNRKRNSIFLNSGYESQPIEPSPVQAVVNRVQDEAINHKEATRFDQLTYITAKEYLQQHQPRVLYLGLGETDEAAHQGRYDLYLQHAAATDRMLADLWHWVQTTPGYKDNTTFLITTDHGRGTKANRWNVHGSFVKGSSQTWLAVAGPGIEAIGEVKEDQQWYQQQIAQTIAMLLGEEFNKDVAAAPIQFPGKTITGDR